MSDLKQIIADSLISYSADDIPLLEIFHDLGKRRREVYPTLLKVLTPLRFYARDAKVN
jgi:hypothetical protein